MNKSRSILKLTKNLFYKKCGPKLIFFFLERFGHFLTQKIDFECPGFMIFDATVPYQHYRYQKTILQHLIFFCKNEACVNCETHKRH